MLLPATCLFSMNMYVAIVFRLRFLQACIVAF